MSAHAPVIDQKQRTGFKRILMATDFSDPSSRALGYALAMARQYAATLSVVHAIPLEPLPPEMNSRRQQAEQQLRRLGEEVGRDEVSQHLLLEEGPVWDVLSSLIARENIDLLVLGTHGRGGLKKIALGSIAEQVLRQASCPVLTIGPHVALLESRAIKFDRILFATDFGPASLKAFPCALSLAEDSRGKLFLLHMIPPMPGRDVGPAAYGPSSYAAGEFTSWQQNAREEGARRLRQLLPPDANLAEEPQYVTGIDFLPEGILEAAATYNVQLIIMGANRSTSPRIAAHTPWALTHEVICRAQCPVLTVSNQGG